MKSVQRKIEDALTRRMHKQMLRQLPEPLLALLQEEADRAKLDTRLQAAWKRHAGMSLHEFAAAHPDLTQNSDLAKSVFVNDLLKGRLNLDIQPLTPDKYDEMRVSMYDDASSLEEAVERFAQSTMRMEFKNAIWPLPRHGVFGALLDDIAELKNAGEDQALAHSLTSGIELYLDDLEAQVEAMSDTFLFARTEKFNGVPLRYKPPQGRDTRVDANARLPHTDPYVVFLFVLEGGGTILFKRDHLGKAENLRFLLPTTTKPLVGYEVTPTPSLLMMSSFQPHAAFNVARDTPYSRITSRAFMIEGPRVLDGMTDHIGAPSVQGAA
jgi:hypothetical protein